jgi:hypothetical protein
LFWTYQRFSGEKCGTLPRVRSLCFWKRREHTSKSWKFLDKKSHTTYLHHRTVFGQVAKRSCEEAKKQRAIRLIYTREAAATHHMTLSYQFFANKTST